MNGEKFVLWSRTVLTGLFGLIIGLLSFASKHEFVLKYPDVVATIVAINGMLTVIFHYISRKKPTLRVRPRR